MTIKSLKVAFWDVQHGSATHIQTPNGRHFVVDLGTGSTGSQREFSPLLWLRFKYGVTRLDGVLITHPHRDHLDDIFNLGGLSPRVFLRSTHLSDSDIRGGNKAGDDEVLERYIEFDRAYGGAVEPGASPFDPANNGGVGFQWFVPQNCPRSNLNDHSMVLVVAYGKSKLLITGDNEACSWAELLAQRDFRSAIAGTDILLAPHHGRESGYYDDLFDYITPKLTVISDGQAGTTSVTAKYGAKSSGWKVHRRNGTSEPRNCVTTRRDGVVVVEFGTNPGGQSFIQVTIN